tara:strand:- start:447 stop:659 length:213 start_codon:yes stop_codon:yes gene_type:complete
MIKFVNIFLFFLLLSNCSIDTKTGIWENKNEISSNKKLSTLSFDENVPFEKFKENVIIYGKKSDYPKLMD